MGVFFVPVNFPNTFSCVLPHLTRYITDILTAKETDCLL